MSKRSRYNYQDEIFSSLFSLDHSKLPKAAKDDLIDAWLVLSLGMGQSISLISELSGMSKRSVWRHLQRINAGK